MSQPVAPTVSDRLLAAFRALIRAELPQLSFYGMYEYSIQAATSSTVDCSPTDTTISLPSLTKVPTRFGFLSVSLSAVDVGKKCLIMFINADPSRPVCVSVDADTGILAKQIARLGDPVATPSGPGTIGPVILSRASVG